jgi:hypothetical protein
MKEEKRMELTEGSEYKITSLGGRDAAIETKGTFIGFISIGIDETGLLIKLNKSHNKDSGKIRIIPLHVILLIDILKTIENQKKDEYKGMTHYVG